MKKLTLRMKSLEFKVTAATNGYLAACFIGDEAEKARLRDELHTYIDVNLDTMDEMFKITFGSIKG
ncbi:MAG: hypothetical protein KJZ83_00195 [Burkholderiaceae bacterium]|nr:hypothetical protein [Burkholderiaceae bacterium]